MKDYQKKFILLNMILIGAVLLSILIAVNVYLYHVYYTGLQSTMIQLVKPFDSFSENFHEKSNAGNQENSAVSKENIKNIVTVFYSKDTDTISFLSKDSNLDTEWVHQAVFTIITQESSYGTILKYNIIYYKEKTSNNYKIAFTGTDYIYKSMINSFLILLLIFILSMFFFLIISYYISKLAVKPFEKALEMEQQFVTDISHDLKTPLTVILANNSILLKKTSMSFNEQKQWLDSTETAAKNMLQMIHEMLTLSSLDSASKVIQKKQVDFSAIVTKAALQMESVAYERGILVETVISENIYIFADAEYIQRICTNLIDNAMKYEPDGGKIIILLSARKKKATLTIHNDTAFIAAEDLSHIFERFYQSDKSRSGQNGHGLGLSITKRMTEMMSGNIEVESTPEFGTSFYVRFTQIS